MAQDVSVKILKKPGGQHHVYMGITTVIRVNIPHDIHTIFCRLLNHLYNSICRRIGSGANEN